MASVRLGNICWYRNRSRRSINSIFRLMLSAFVPSGFFIAIPEIYHVGPLASSKDMPYAVYMPDISNMASVNKMIALPGARLDPSERERLEAMLARSIRYQQTGKEIEEECRRLLATCTPKLRIVMRRRA